MSEPNPELLRRAWSGALVRDSAEDSVELDHAEDGNSELLFVSWHSIALVLSYDKRDRWLTAKLCNHADANRFLEARSAKSLQAVALYDGMLSGWKLIEVRSGERWAETAPIATSVDELTAPLGILMHGLHRFASNILSGAEPLPDVTPLAPTITVRRRIGPT